MHHHVELHRCPTAADAARLGHAGLPRYDIESTRCSNCAKPCGEVHNEDGTSVAWRPLTVVVWDEGVDVLCGTCTKPVDRLLQR